MFSQLANGVTLFFALSGFLLFLPFAAAVIRDEPRPAFSAYLRNRALRILPAYWFILLFAALVLQSLRVDPGGTGVGALDNLGLLLRNLFLIQNYDPATIATGISAAWSLAVEIIFYLLLPLLVLCGIRLAGGVATRSRRVLAMLAPAALMGVVGVASSLLGPRIGHEEATVPTWGGVWDVSFLTHAQLFAPGLALAVARVEYQDGRLHLPRWWRGAAVVTALALAAVAIKMTADGWLPERAEVALIAISCGLLLALVVLPPTRSRFRLLSVLESRGLIAAGLISYSVYLWHVPVIFWLQTHGLTLGGGAGAFAVNLAMVATITGSLSWLTYRYVEKPALRHKARGHVGESEPPPVSVPTTDPAMPVETGRPG